MFFDKNSTLIDHITDDDSEIKPGDTLFAQLDCYEDEYDHVEVYFTGRASKH